MLDQDRKKQKITHIISKSENTIYVITNPFIDFINKNFDNENHEFVIVNDTTPPSEIMKNKNVTAIDIRKRDDFKSLINRMRKSDKIIFHSIYPLTTLHLIKLVLKPSILNKSFWAIWGGDLYRYAGKKLDVKKRFKYHINKMFISRLAGIITHIYGDYELAKKLYGTSAKYYYSFMYPSNTFKNHTANYKKSGKKNVYHVQVGNSADPTNNHIEILEKLRKYKDRNIEIFCPLAYGSIKYKEKVIKLGSEIFGDKFKAITEIVPYNEYLNYLSKIDIAIFNHKRQQAIGNITTLLGLGKKVYIREEITTWKFCTDHDLKVYSSNGNFEDIFVEMDDEIKQMNIKNVKNKFSEEKLVEDWNTIFKGDS